MDDSLLIILVERYEELYNLKHPQYSNLQRRDNIWEEIGSIMKQEGNICRERWARIRDNYRKALNLRKTKSGQAACKIKAPKFNKELRFLVPFLNDEENRRSNISGSEHEDDSTLSSLPDNIRNSDGPTPSPPIIRSYGPCPSPPITRSTPIYSPDYNTQSTSSDNTTNRRRHNTSSFRNRSSGNETTASVLRQYLSSKEEQKATASSTAYQHSNFDPLTDFFLTMAKTVQTFPKHEQVNIKAEIFQIINRTEMRLATTANLNLASTSSYDMLPASTINTQPCASVVVTCSPSYEMSPPSTVNTQLCESQNMFTEKPDSRNITVINDTYINPMLSTALHTSHLPPSRQLMIHPTSTITSASTAASTSRETNLQQNTTEFPNIYTYPVLQINDITETQLNDYTDLIILKK